MDTVHYWSYDSALSDEYTLGESMIHEVDTLLVEWLEGLENVHLGDSAEKTESLEVCHYGVPWRTLPLRCPGLHSSHPRRE